MYPTAMSVEMADILLPVAEWLETAYVVQRMHKLLIRRDIVHLYEAVDETMAWSWIAFAMAERGHERFKIACDPEQAKVEGAPISAYWRTYDEYKEYLANFAGSGLAEASASALGAGLGFTVALLLFVGIPLPGTGAWTGTLAASILDMKFKDVLIACMGGVLLAVSYTHLRAHET